MSRTEKSSQGLQFRSQGSWDPTPDLERWNPGSKLPVSKALACSPFVQASWSSPWTLPPYCSVTLGKLFKHPGPQLLHPESGDNNNSFSIPSGEKEM